MSKQKRDCYHCKIINQAKLRYEIGYSREYIVEHMLRALADFIVNTSPEFEERIDIIADCMRKGIAGELRKRVLAAQTPAGRA